MPAPQVAKVAELNAWSPGLLVSQLLFMNRKKISYTIVMCINHMSDAFVHYFKRSDIKARETC